MLFVTGLIWQDKARHLGYLSRAQQVQFRCLRMGIACLCIALVISVPETNWPLRVTFHLSQPALKAIADRVARGEKVPFPVRAGCFTVQQAEMRDLGRNADLPPVLHLTLGSGYGFVRGAYQDACYDAPGHGVECLEPLAPTWFQFEDE